MATCDSLYRLTLSLANTSRNKLRSEMLNREPKLGKLVALANTIDLLNDWAIDYPPQQRFAWFHGVDHPVPLSESDNNDPRRNRLTTTCERAENQPHSSDMSGGIMVVEVCEIEEICDEFVNMVGSENLTQSLDSAPVAEKHYEPGILKNLRGGEQPLARGMATS